MTALKIRTSAVALVCLASAALTAASSGQEPQAPWVEQKCRAYQAAWEQALDFYGSDEMNYAFVAGNENFIAGGCAEPADICPSSAQELEVANALTLALMNAGTASTFLPFRCADASPAAGGWTGPGL